jgi:hypothetical protein
MNDKIGLDCYCDASYVDNYDYRTTMGYIIFMNGNPVILKTKINRNNVHKSSCEVEYIAFASTTYFNNLLSELIPNPSLLCMYMQIMKL